MDWLATGDFVNNLIQSTGGGFAVIITIIAAIVQCFYGYRLFRYLVTILGFGIFAGLGYGIGVPVSGEQHMIAIGIAIVLGLIGAFAAFRFYKVGVFIQSFTGGAIIGGVIATYLGWNVAQSIALAIVVGVFVGMAGIKLIKPVIVVSTGLTGGMHTGITLAALVGISGIIGSSLGLALSACGILYQINDLRKISKREKEAKEEKAKGGTIHLEDKKDEATFVEDVNTEVKAEDIFIVESKDESE